MNAQTVDPGSELRIRVQTSLETAPIIGATPVRDQLLYRGEGNTLLPIIDGLAFRPARGLQATARVADRRTRRHHSERRDSFRGARQWRWARLCRYVASNRHGRAGQCAARDPHEKIAPRSVGGDRIGAGAWGDAHALFSSVGVHGYRCGDECYGLEPPRSCISHANATPLPPPCSVRILAASASVDSRAQSRCHTPLRAIHVIGTAPACTNRRTAMSCASTDTPPDASVTIYTS